MTAFFKAIAHVALATGFLISSGLAQATEGGLPVKVKIIGYRDVVRICSSEQEPPIWCPEKFLSKNPYYDAAAPSPEPQAQLAAADIAAIRREAILQARERGNIVGVVGVDIE